MPLELVTRRRVCTVINTRLSMYVECEELIKRMLTVEPVRRITIPEITYHRWMTMAGMDPEFDKLMHESIRPLSPEPLEPLNEIVLKHMDRLEIDRKQTLKVDLH